MNITCNETICEVIIIFFSDAQLTYKLNYLLIHTYMNFKHTITRRSQKINSPHAYILIFINFKYFYDPTLRKINFSTNRIDYYIKQ